MTWNLRLTIATCALVACPAFGQTLVPTDSEYVKLLRATRFVENFKEAAEVSARIFAVRGQGTDAEYAQAMNKVAKANLSSADPCIISIYSSQGLSSEDVTEVTAFFTSPLGVKVLDESQRTHLENIKAFAVKPMPTTSLTDAEKRELAAVYQKSSMRKYAAMSTNQVAAKGMLQCIFKAAGVQ